MSADMTKEQLAQSIKNIKKTVPFSPVRQELVVENIGTFKLKDKAGRDRITFGLNELQKKRFHSLIIQKVRGSNNKITLFVKTIKQPSPIVVAPKI